MGRSFKTLRPMNIKTIASSSAGCCYLIESGGEQLLIECGISLKKIREALDFDLSKVVGCLISHEHKDHCKYAEDIYHKASIPLHGPIELTNHFDIFGLKPVTHGAPFLLGLNFHVTPIHLPHDVECYGYIVRTIKERGNILFYATDTGGINYTFPGLTHLMIETNHSMEALFESDLNKSVVARIADNHLSIDNALEFAERHKDTLKEVHLMHLSDKHGDEKLFKTMAQEALGVPIYIAGKTGG